MGQHSCKGNALAFCANDIATKTTTKLFIEKVAYLLYHNMNCRELTVNYS